MDDTKLDLVDNVTGLVGNDYPFSSTVVLFGTELSPLHRYPSYCWHFHLYTFFYANVQLEYTSDFESSLSVQAFDMAGDAGTC